MTVAQTSRDAFDGIKKKLGPKQQEVYEALKELGSATNEELSSHLGWEINRITPRTHELVTKFDMAAVVGVGVNKSGSSAKRFAPKDINDRSLKDLVNDCEA